MKYISKLKPMESLKPIQEMTAIEILKELESLQAQITIAVVREAFHQRAYPNHKDSMLDDLRERKNVLVLKYQELLKIKT